jgi:hypothetical protein
MTKMLDAAIAAVRRLPPDQQDAIASAMIGLADGDDAPELIDPAHQAAIAEGVAQVQRGDFASEQEVEAVFRRFER